MIVTHNLSIDLRDKGAVPQIDATQDDQYTRDLAISLYEGDTAWAIPTDAAVVIRYCKSDGVGGEYDTLPDGTTAWSAEENVLRLALAPQVLTVPGTVMLSASLIREAEVISIFAVAISVRPRIQGIFAESAAYYNVAGFLPGPVSAEVGQYLRIAQVNEEGRVVALEGADGPSGGAATEPAPGDIPRVFFGSALPQTKTDTVMSWHYVSGTMDVSGWCKTKAQGNSSMSYPKKNQTVKLYADSACEEKQKLDLWGWGEESKYCFKANWIDLTHARNVVSARLWADVVKSRSSYAELPELFRTSPNQGAVDGFPVKVYAGGVYQGRYTLNIPKDKWTFNMDDELDEHCVLCGEGYVSGCFRAASVAQWTDEIHDSMPSTISSRWIEIINFVMNSTDEEFKTNLNQYFFVDSLIDYHLFGLASCGLDAYGKNQIYATYDGQKWIASMYDMDATWGLWWNGSKFVASDYDRSEYQDFQDGEGNLLYIRLEQLFWEELQTRWAELKSGALSIENIINRFEQFTDIAPAELVKEDYASTTGGGSFTGIPSQSTNNIQQIRAFALARHTWTDEYVAALTGESVHTHSYTETVTTEATCTTDGVKTFTCECGDNYIESIPATGHSWDEGVVTVEPTEETEGVKTYTCTVCGETYTETIAALGHEHSYVSTVVEPTCTEQGYTEHVCACGDSYKDTYVDAAGHTYVDGVCSVCGAEDPDSEVPLYSFENGTFTFADGGVTLTVTNGNQIYLSGTSSSSEKNLNKNLKDLSGSPDGINTYGGDNTEWFTLAAGDVVKVEVTKGSSHTEASMSLYLRTTAGKNTDIYQGTDKETTITADMVIGSIGMWNGTSDTDVIDITVKIYVNDVRYI